MRFRHCHWRNHNIFGVTIDATGLYVFFGYHSFCWERRCK